MTTDAQRPPGKARITACPDGNAGVDSDGDSCLECDGTGVQIWRACPWCGDMAFEYLNGHNEAAGMRCAIGCGNEWAADDPGCLAQHLPRHEAA
jgi:hypothetical protein